MTEKQYRQVRDNRYVHRPAEVFGGHRVADWLSRVASQVQQLEDAADAWARVAEPNWLLDTRVRAFGGGVLEIAVVNSATLYELRRQAAPLQRHLAPYVRGLQRLKFVLVASLDDEESPGGGSAA